MSELRAAIAGQLRSVEIELRRLQRWEAAPPPPERLASEVPFCHDTLEFTQWLQWVFIPRFRAVLEGDHPLPTACGIAPIAELAFTELDGDTAALLDSLRDIDRLVTGQEAPR